MASKRSQGFESFTVQTAETLTDEATRDVEKHDCSLAFLKIQKRWKLIINYLALFTQPIKKK